MRRGGGRSSACEFRGNREQPNKQPKGGGKIKRGGSRNFPGKELQGPNNKKTIYVQGRQGCGGKLYDKDIAVGRKRRSISFLGKSILKSWVITGKKKKGRVR